MLKTTTLVGLLKQPIEQHHHGSTGHLFSSILLTPSGQLVANYHTTETPSKQQKGSGENSNSALKPYDIDPGMKTKIFCLFASTTWREYTQQSLTGSSSDKSPKWISLKTSEAIVFIHQVNDRFLYVLIASTDTPLGLLRLKAEQMVVLLRESLGDFSL